ncbi:hypothetical protein GTH32_09120 [Alteromonas sp. 345S023]|uniref:DUF1236 domain-containing protein n=1 Tax=Alteromonas profundi TaxID=2696062 RepID=A0A7X5RKU1_9ALTE|nr:DUF6515 family protein [Alteromonas profundi]NDV91338.1 hypothetical protein [Alteromonas profundi]
MRFRFFIVTAVAATLIAGCAHSHGGGRGHVHAGANVGGRAGAVAVGIGIGALITNVLTHPRYKIDHTPLRIPDNAKDIHFHGVTYHYHKGVYYRKIDGRFHVVKPPLGITVAALGPHPDTIIINGDTYYVEQGVYYYRSGGQYIVVDEPKIPSGKRNTKYVSGQFYTDLPSRAQPVNINGIQYFTFDGVFFLPQPVNGKVRYLVVELNK